MLTLIEVTSRSIQKYSNTEEDLIGKVSRSLDEDIARMKEIKSNKSTDDSFSFRYSKLLDLLVQSKKYIDLNWRSIREADVDKLLNRSDGVSWYGTSMLNYMQTSMLEILSVIHDTPVSELACLKEKNVYQLETSPNIQASSIVKTNKNISSEELGKKFSLMSNWRWSIRDKLVAPSLGFSFGGSRYDKEYEKKLYKTHDASSFVGEFLKFDRLSTRLLHVIIDPESDKDLDLFEDLEKLSKLVRWKKHETLPHAGNIILIKKYCAFVTEVDEKKSTIELMGFTRNMPLMEGLVKGTYLMDKDGKLKKKLDSALFKELSIYLDEAHSTNASSWTDSESMAVHFFEVIRDY